MKKLSVITPLYNTSNNYLNDVLASVYEKDIELILVNDSPNNEKLARKLEQIHNPQVKILRNERNLGIFEAYYRGFQAASGEYCCILDHDDVCILNNILTALDKNPDIVYTNEYKFYDNEKGKKTVSEKYKKPEFDVLSALFYLYMHHITALRTSVLQEQLKRHRDFGKYTSIFDIHMILEYLSAFVGKKMIVIHIDSYDYGWRVHANSTAYRLDQKLSGYYERVKKTSEFLMRYGETPLLSIDAQVGYLVRGEFLSMHDMTAYPLTFADFSEKLQTENGFYGTELSMQLCGNSFTSDDIMHFFNLLSQLPAKYLAAQKCFPLVIPTKTENDQIDSQNLMLHVPNVPFLSSAGKATAGLVIYQNINKQPKISDCQAVLIRRQ